MGEKNKTVRNFLFIYISFGSKATKTLYSSYINLIMTQWDKYKYTSTQSLVRFQLDPRLEGWEQVHEEEVN
jgi:hypothetical protein